MVERRSSEKKCNERRSEVLEFFFILSNSFYFVRDCILINYQISVFPVRHILEVSCAENEQKKYRNEVSFGFTVLLIELYGL